MTSPSASEAEEASPAEDSRALRLPETTAAASSIPLPFSQSQTLIDDGPLCNLIINYLPPFMDEEATRQLFFQFGPIYTAKVIYDKETGESRGYGFIRYECFFSATYAIAYLNRYDIAGKRLKVAYANVAAARKCFEEVRKLSGFTERQRLILDAVYQLSEQSQEAGQAEEAKEG